MKQQNLSLDGFDPFSSATTDERGVQTPSIREPITLINDYLNVSQQTALLRESSAYPFQSPEIEVYDQRHKIPRSQVWFADPYCDILYSGLRVKALSWPKYAGKLRQKLQRDFNLLFSGVLVNHYADGKASMGWHSDNELEFAKGSDIASVTLGASRDFVIIPFIKEL